MASMADSQAPVAADMARLAADLFERAGWAIQIPALRPELDIAAAGDTAKAGMLAAAISLRRVLCQSPDGRQALSDLGFEPVFEHVEGK